MAGPWPDSNDNPVNSFLQNFFAVRNMRQDAKLGITKLGLEKQKFDAEQANHQADMKQRADQFGQELQLRQNEQNFQKSQQDYVKSRDNQNDLQNFLQRDKGMLMPTPQDQTINFGTAAPMTTPNAVSKGDSGVSGFVNSLMGPQSPVPVGPQVSGMNPGAMEQNIQQGLPIGNNAGQRIPYSAQLSAEAQRPDPTDYTRVNTPLAVGTGTEAYIPTAGKIAKDATAAKQADWTTFSPAIGKMMDDTGLESPWEVGDKMNPHDEDLFFKVQAAKQARDQSLAAKGAQSEATLAEEKRWHDMQALFHEQTAATKKNNGVSDEEIQANHASIMDNPDSFDKLSSKEKSAEAIELHKEGLPRPTTLSAIQKDQEQYARRARQAVNSIESALADPHMHNAKGTGVIDQNSGPVLGKLGDLEQMVGDTSRMSDTDKQAAQAFRSNVRYLTFTEGKALFGSRIPIQLMNELKQTNPSTNKALPLLRGSLDGVNNYAENTLISDEQSRFGGVKMRANFLKDNNISRTGVSQQEVTDLPPSFANSLQEGVATHFDEKDPKTGALSGPGHSFVKRNGRIYEIK